MKNDREDIYLLVYDPNHLIDDLISWKKNISFFKILVFLPECSVDVVFALSTTVRVDWIELDPVVGRCSLEKVIVLFIGGEDISTTLVIV